ncbi:radical SAM family heme chaperone HemW [Bacteroidia bacterium]|nr:radical SAM family heme chaperone HemW [Bacteroidia bacterium]MDB9882430.1 radical SAM family heme chaperone HemW [Bacteroidia bacterium]
MAGIYIHIPFCKKACFYCDFHFSVSFKSKLDILQAINTELVRRRSFIGDEQVETIYFGGGTPSVLLGSELDQIMTSINRLYSVAENAEITFECNPDDLTLEYLKVLKKAGINRLSLGIQSFNDEHLEWMNRSHTNDQSLQCIQDASGLGFKDINIDLIYGIPQLSEDEWKDTIELALALPVNHLSAYSLTMEENTPYNKLVKQQKYQKPDDDLASVHFEVMVNAVEKAGWEHYEVSNFCKAGNYSKHNTAYWQNKKYLGIGPSAHSFDGVNRSWNVSSNVQYLEKIESNLEPYKTELLTNEDRLNETLLTGIRTKWGVDLVELRSEYKYNLMELFPVMIAEWQLKEWVVIEEENFRLSSQGLLFADYIASELFSVSD